jgi:polysaccharide export outer membrane protein
MVVAMNDDLGMAGTMSGYRSARLSVSVVGILVGLQSCTSLPDSGPTTSAVTGGATVVATAEPEAIGFHYALLDIRQSILPHVSADGRSLASTFGLGQAPAPEIRVGVGDVISVTIFESASGGLFIPQDAGSRPGNYVELPDVTIDRAGLISVPYAGSVPALGRTLREIEADIVKRLASRAIEPQAVVSMVSQHSTDVAVIGHVNSPGRFSINTGGERVLDLIARAGGLKKEPYESSVTVQRGTRRATVAFEALIEKPPENIYVGVGDTIYVYAETKSYVAIGATGQQQKYDFGAKSLSLAEAVGLAGGLLDSRADPGQVFVYRLEDRAALVKMGVDLSGLGEGREIPTIYRANMRESASLFAARKFVMRDKDVLYVSNASSVELVKFLNVLDSVSVSTAGTPSDVVTARDAVHQLGRAAHQ